MSTTTTVKRKPCRELRIHACDKYDREAHRSRFYITRSDNRNYLEYTNNPVKMVHEVAPTSIAIEVHDFDSDYLGLYVNSFVNEGYGIDGKRATTKDDFEDGGVSVWGHHIYFKKKDGA
jgi:hypothetical protein